MFVRIRNLSIWTMAACIFFSASAIAQNQQSFRDVSPAHAQQKSRQNDDMVSGVREKLESIYAVARQAKGAEHYTECLVGCKQVYESKLASPEESDFLRRLSAWLYVQRGEVYSQAAVRAEANGDPRAETYERQALKDYSAAVEWGPSWRAYHNRGVSNAILGHYKEALADFNKAISTNTDQQHPSSYFNRAEVLYELGQLEDAVRDYTRALSADPADVQALTGRAHAKFELNQSAEALRDFDEAIQLDPQNAVTFADRGDLHASVGNWRQAATDFQQAIKLDRKLGRAYQSAAWLMATCPDEKLQNRDLALKAANRAIKLDGQSDYRYLDTAAAALANAGKYQDAIKYLQQALQNSPPPEVIPDLRNRLSIYQAGRPYRDSIQR
ncbi:MAG: tetratricopeptide repeat protein [Planctomycetales bacterium]|nr:tetratricopeptide repeat protein [Planctomycetales bacterium]